MNARLIVVVLLAVALGAASVTFAPLFSAPVPEPKPKRWEYKVASLTTGLRADGDPADKLTEQINALAKDGWEFAGPLSAAGRGNGPTSSQYVVFRRFKS